MLKYKIHILIIVFLGIGLLFLKSKYNEAIPNTSLLKTEVELDPKSFMELVNSTNSMLSKELIEKAIEIEGTVDKVIFRNGIASLLLSADDTDSVVICQMQTNQKERVAKMKAGDLVTVKGIYKGILLDAILLHCVVENN